MATRRTTLAGGGLAGGLPPGALAACTGGTEVVGTASASGAGSPSTSSSAGPSGSAGAPGGETGGSAPVSGADGSLNSTMVNCSGNSCAVTLQGNSTVTVLGTTLRLSGIQNGRATLAVGDQTPP